MGTIDPVKLDAANKAPVAFEFSEGNFFYYPPMTVAIKTAVELNIGNFVDLIKLCKTTTLIEKTYPYLSLKYHNQLFGFLKNKQQKMGKMFRGAFSISNYTNNLLRSGFPKDVLANMVHSEQGHDIDTIPLTKEQ